MLIDDVGEDVLRSKANLEEARRRYFEARCKEHVIVRKSEPEEYFKGYSQEFPDWGAARCFVCGESLGWYCPDSPDGACHYSKGEGCDYCGEPSERK